MSIVYAPDRILNELDVVVGGHQPESRFGLVVVDRSDDTVRGVIFDNHSHNAIMQFQVQSLHNKSFDDFPVWHLMIGESFTHGVSFTYVLDYAKNSKVFSERLAKWGRETLSPMLSAC